MKKLMAISMLVAMMCVMLVGMFSCQAVQNKDGSTGWKIGVTPEQHRKGGEAGDAVTGTLGMLSGFFPILAPFATLAGGATITWKRMKNKVTKFEDPMTMYVKILEDIKQNDPDFWSKVRAKIKAEHPTIDFEQTVREIKATLAKTGDLPTVAAA